MHIWGARDSGLQGIGGGDHSHDPSHNENLFPTGQSNEVGIGPPTSTAEPLNIGGGGANTAIITASPTQTSSPPPPNPSGNAKHVIVFDSGAFNSNMKGEGQPGVFLAGPDFGAQKISWTVSISDVSILNVQLVDHPEVNHGTANNTDLVLDKKISDNAGSFSLDLKNFPTKWSQALLSYVAVRVDWEWQKNVGYTQSEYFVVVDSRSNNRKADLDSAATLIKSAGPDGKGFENGLPIDSVPSSWLSTPTSSPASTSSPTPAVSSASHSKSDGGLSTPAIAGIAVGAVVIAILIISAMAFLYLRRRRQEKPSPITYVEKSIPEDFASDITPKVIDKRATQASYLSVSKIGLADGGPEPDPMPMPMPMSPMSPIYQSRGVNAPNAPASAPAATAAALATHHEGPSGSRPDVSNQGAVPSTVAHLVEDGMTVEEIRRLEEEERQLDAEIAAASRR